MSDEKQEGATPGPWWVEDTDRGSLIIGAGNEHLATVNNYYLVAERNAANARLISAAPDLLAALNVCLTELTAPHMPDTLGNKHAVLLAGKARADAMPTIGAAVKKGGGRDGLVARYRTAIARWHSQDSRVAARA